VASVEGFAFSDKQRVESLRQAIVRHLTDDCER
jgi:hypothetical protein